MPRLPLKWYSFVIVAIHSDNGMCVEVLRRRNRSYYQIEITRFFREGDEVKDTRQIAFWTRSKREAKDMYRNLCRLISTPLPLAFPRDWPQNW